MDVNDLQDADALLEMMAYDGSLSFLDEMEASSDSMATLLDDDPPVIRQTLLFSDSQTTDTRKKDATASTTGVGEAIRLKAEQTKKPVDVKTRSTTNTRQKEELQHLRSEAAQLETQLAHLKLAQDTTKPRPLTEPSTWEEIAKRQSEEKQRVVVENGKLRELLEQQLKVAKRLEKLLNKRVLDETARHLSSSSQLSHHLIARQTNADATLEEIRARIHLQLDDVDAAMEECGLCGVFAELEETQWTTRRADHNTIEIRTVKVLPFPVGQVAEVVWKHVSATHIDLQNGFVEASKVCESTCDLNVVVRIQQRRAECVMVVNGVVARRTDADRSLLVFEAVGSAQGTVVAPNPIGYREFGYASIQKSSNVASSTIVRICKRLRVNNVQQQGNTAADDRTVGSFMDLILGSYGETTKTLLQLVENSLVEESLKRPAAST